MKENSYDYLFTFAFGIASLLELQSVLDFLRVGSIKSFDQNAAIVNCSEADAHSIISRAGGINKVAKILSSDLSEAAGMMFLPDRPKFNWTVAGYGCGQEMILEARQEVHLALKKSSLGKSKFLEPKERGSIGNAFSSIEIDVADLSRRVLGNKGGEPGFEFDLYCPMGNTSKALYAQTIGTVDVDGYAERDFARPYQDPRKTVSPRLARVLVNMSLTRKSRVLDPFCGLGTTLGEALICGCNVVGTDRSQDNISKAAENLKWITSRFDAKSESIHLFAFDARRISKASMPPVDAIATEPILLPIYRSNPSYIETREDLDRARETYTRCFPEFATVLRNKGSRLAFMSPSIFDSSGRERTFSLDEAARDAGFRPYRGKLSIKENYPLRIKSVKKRIVHRNLNVYELA